jgi:microcin C transport system substrate-binding protein
MKRLVFLLITALTLWAPVASAQAVERKSLAMWGKAALPDDFRHFPYVDPAAPKGGRIVIGYPGTFDNLNPLILRGVAPRSISIVLDTLMTAAADELGAVYPLIAQSVELADDLSSAVFNLNPAARFHDGQPITAEDVTFTWEALQAHGDPFARAFLDKVTAVEALDSRRVKITLSTTGRIKPIIDFAATVAPRPRHWWTAEGRDISKTTQEPPLGSGPYRVAVAESGRFVAYERVADYWGGDLPVNRGLYNFDQIKFDYYRDDEVLFEAFKSGAVDLRLEHRAQRWVTGYDFPALQSGKVKREVIPTKLPLGAQGFRLNLRRPLFADARVREALTYLFDFPWLHKNILAGQYRRTRSNFPNSDYGADGPPTEAELALLRPLADDLDPRALTQAFIPPGDDGDGRSNLRAALRLLKEAGWELKDGVQTNVQTGEPFKFEFVDDNPALNRVTEPYIASLKRAGIAATIRNVDSAQMKRRQDDFDFDVTAIHLGFYPPPGAELKSYFGSAAADVKGAANHSGVKSRAVDALIDKALEAQDEESAKTAVRALDRALLWRFAFIPHWHNPETWIAWWDKFGRPAAPPPGYDMGFRATWIPATWWAKPF